MAAASTCPSSDRATRHQRLRAGHRVTQPETELRDLRTPTGIRPLSPKMPGLSRAALAGRSNVEFATERVEVREARASGDVTDAGVEQLT